MQIRIKFESGLFLRIYHYFGLMFYVSKNIFKKDFKNKKKIKINKQKWRPTLVKKKSFKNQK